VKASRVKGLRPGSKLGGAAQRIARQRVIDLLSFDKAVRDPGNVRELHDLRIAAKRLRYTLEVLGGVLGPAAAVVEDEARSLQDLLGEIHDCDVLGPRLETELANLAHDDAHAVATLADGDPDATPRVLRDAPGRATRHGVQALAVGVAARRAVLYERFLLRWEALLAGSVLTALTHPQRPALATGDEREERGALGELDRRAQDVAGDAAEAAHGQAADGERHEHGRGDRQQSP
jgi:hypothetical protein